MGQLAENVAVLTTLIKKGQTREAMERFYADDVTLQENETTARRGKSACLTQERRMLSRVSSVRPMAINQAIPEAEGVVFTAWLFEGAYSPSRRFPLSEVSVQQWRQERIVSKNFHYAPSLD